MSSSLVTCLKPVFFAAKVFGTLPLTVIDNAEVKVFNSSFLYFLMPGLGYLYVLTQCMLSIYFEAHTFLQQLGFWQRLIVYICDVLIWFSLMVQVNKIKDIIHNIGHLSKKLQIRGRTVRGITQFTLFHILFYESFVFVYLLFSIKTSYFMSVQFLIGLLLMSSILLQPLCLGVIIFSHFIICFYVLFRRLNSWLLVCEKQPLPTDMSLIHDQLLTCCQTINNIFSISNSIILFSLMVSILESMFHLAISNDETVLYHCAIWIFFSFANLFVLSLPCHLLSAESKKVGFVVHQVLMKTSNEKLKEQLRDLSQSVLHNKVKFHAGGVIQINLKTISKICTGVATYFMIQMQFHMLNNNNKVKTNETIFDIMLDISSR